jgi:hypothetical protein
MTNTMALYTVLLLVVVALIALPTPTQGSFVDQPLFLSLSLSLTHTHKRLASTWSTSHAHNLTTSNSPLPGAITVSGAGGPFIAPLMNYLTDAYQVPRGAQSERSLQALLHPHHLSLLSPWRSSLTVSCVVLLGDIQFAELDATIVYEDVGVDHAIELLRSGSIVRRPHSSFVFSPSSLLSSVLRQKNEKGDEKKNESEGF